MKYFWEGFPPCLLSRSVFRVCSAVLTGRLYENFLSNRDMTGVRGMMYLWGIFHLARLTAVGQTGLTQSSLAGVRYSLLDESGCPVLCPLSIVILLTPPQLWRPASAAASSLADPNIKLGIIPDWLCWPICPELQLQGTESQADLLGRGSNTQLPNSTYPGCGGSFRILQKFHANRVYLFVLSEEIYSLQTQHDSLVSLNWFSITKPGQMRGGEVVTQPSRHQTRVLTTNLLMPSVLVTVMKDAIMEKLFPMNK